MLNVRAVGAVSKSRAKGTAAESAVVAYLQANGFSYAERRALAGINDKGDISGVPGWVIEVKNCSQASVGAWLIEASIEATNASVDCYCVWHKRAGKGSPGDWYVTVPAEVFVTLCVLEVRPLPLINVRPVTMTGAAFVQLLRYGAAVAA